MARRTSALAIAFLALAALPAYADDAWDKCSADDPDESIAGCTEVIERGNEESDHNRAIALTNRGIAHRVKGDYDAAFADFDRAIAFDPDYASAYNSRGFAYDDQGEYDKALADYDKAVALDPDFADAYNNRGATHVHLEEPEAAIADYSKAIEVNPDYGSAYYNRGVVYSDQGEYDKAIADYDAAIAAGDEDSATYNNRGFAYFRKDDHEHSIPDYSKAIELDADNGLAYLNRGIDYAASGESDKALADFDKAIDVDPENAGPYFERANLYFERGDHARALIDFRLAQRLAAEDDEAQGEIATRIAEIESELAGAAASAATSAKPDSPTATLDALALPERRVALVIGNGGYSAANALENPPNDADAIAASLKADGFAVVTVAHDLTREGFVEALKAFAADADDADWAVVYYAGHGLEMGGVNYLVPVDARLERDRDVPNEAIPLDSVLSAVEGARKLRLVILDACRNNPFAQRMKLSSAGRAVGRGLARVEPTQATLVAYAAKDGSIALDGDSGNSPFAAALARRLTEPGIEINKLFRLVRSDVLSATDNGQEPFVYGSLPPDDFFFVAPK